MQIKSSTKIKSHEVRFGFCNASFVAGIVLSTALAAITLPLFHIASDVQLDPAQRNQSSVVIDYDRLNATICNYTHSTIDANIRKLVYDTLIKGDGTDQSTDRSFTQEKLSEIRSRQNDDTSSRISAAQKHPSTRYSQARNFIATTPSTRTHPTPSARAFSHSAENGSWRGQLNAHGTPKTVYVRGYHRKDGTYVRGHYRSSPR